MTPKGLCCLAAALGISLVSGAPSKVILGSRECCDASFGFKEVESFAKSLLPSLTEDYYSLRIVPSGGSRQFVIATSSEESVAFCFGVATRLRRDTNHAYLLKTPLGTALHYWSSERKEYRSAVLHGVDVYDMKFSAGRVAWIGNYSDQVPKLWLVSEGTLTLRESLVFAKEVMRTLGVADAVAYVRADPYFWPPDTCSPYSLPLQWQASVPEGDSAVSHITAHCKIRLQDRLEECAEYRSR